MSEVVIMIPGGQPFWLSSDGGDMKWLLANLHMYSIIISCSSIHLSIGRSLIIVVPFCSLNQFRGIQLLAFISSAKISLWIYICFHSPQMQPHTLQIYLFVKVSLFLADSSNLTSPFQYTCVDLITLYRFVKDFL